LADFKALVDGVALGRYTVVGSVEKKPAPLPDVQPDDEDHATPAWLSGYPAGDWRDIVKVAKSLGFDGGKKDDAVAFLCRGEDGPMMRGEFIAILQDLEA
jgi:hypothetical protein